MDFKIDARVDENQSEILAPERNITSNKSIRLLGEDEMNAYLKKLNELNVKPVILSLFKPYCENFTSRSKIYLQCQICMALVSGPGVREK